MVLDLIMSDFITILSISYSPSSWSELVLSSIQIKFLVHKVRKTDLKKSPQCKIIL